MKLLLVLVVLLSALLPEVAAAAVGSHTPQEVNAAVASGLTFLETQQNLDGSFGTALPADETAFALIAYGAADGGDYNALTASQKTHVQSAVTYLLAQQNLDGSFGTSLQTYNTGL